MTTLSNNKLQIEGLNRDIKKMCLDGIRLSRDAMIQQGLFPRVGVELEVLMLTALKEPADFTHGTASSLFSEKKMLELFTTLPKDCGIKDAKPALLIKGGRSKGVDPGLYYPPESRDAGQVEFILRHDHPIHQGDPEVAANAIDALRNFIAKKGPKYGFDIIDFRSQPILDEGVKIAGKPASNALQVSLGIAAVVPGGRPSFGEDEDYKNELICFQSPAPDINYMDGQPRELYGHLAVLKNISMTMAALPEVFLFSAFDGTEQERFDRIRKADLFYSAIRGGSGCTATRMTCNSCLGASADGHGVVLITMLSAYGGTKDLVTRRDNGMYKTGCVIDNNHVYEQAKADSLPFLENNNINHFAFAPDCKLLNNSDILPTNDADLIQKTTSGTVFVPLLNGLSEGLGDRLKEALVKRALLIMEEQKAGRWKAQLLGEQSKISR